MHPAEGHAFPPCQLEGFLGCSVPLGLTASFDIRPQADLESSDNLVTASVNFPLVPQDLKFLKLISGEQNGFPWLLSGWECGYDSTS